MYHGVHWAHSDRSAAFYGEIDFVVVNRYGRAIAIEQKNGKLVSDGRDLLKPYAGGPKPVAAQTPESGMGTTTSASTGCSRARRRPISVRASLTLWPNT